MHYYEAKVSDLIVWTGRKKYMFNLRQKDNIQFIIILSIFWRRTVLFGLIGHKQSEREVEKRLLYS